MMQRPEHDVVSERVDRALSSAIDLHGPSLLLEPARLTRYLELAAEGSAWQPAAVVAAIASEIPQQMLAAYSEDHLTAILPGLVERLTTSRRLDRAQAIWAVRAWGKALALSTRGLDGSATTSPAVVATSTHRASIAEVLGSGMRTARTSSSGPSSTAPSTASSTASSTAPSTAPSTILPAPTAAPIDKPLEATARTTDASPEPASMIEALPDERSVVASRSADVLATEASPAESPRFVDSSRPAKTATPPVVAQGDTSRDAMTRKPARRAAWAFVAVVFVAVAVGLVAMRGVLFGSSSTGSGVESGPVVGRVTEVPGPDRAESSGMTTANASPPEATTASAPPPTVAAPAADDESPQSAPTSPAQAAVATPLVQPTASSATPSTAPSTTLSTTPSTTPSSARVPSQVAPTPAVVTPKTSSRTDVARSSVAPLPSKTRPVAVAKADPARSATTTPATPPATGAIECTRASCGSVVAVRAPTSDVAGMPAQFAHNYEMTIRMDDRSIHTLLQPLPLRPGTRVRMTGNRFTPLPSS